MNEFISFLISRVLSLFEVVRARANTPKSQKANEAEKGGDPVTNEGQAFSDAALALSKASGPKPRLLIAKASHFDKEAVRVATLAYCEANGCDYKDVIKYSLYSYNEITGMLEVFYYK